MAWPGQTHPEVGSDDPFFQRRQRHGHLERRAWRVPPLNGTVVQRPVLVGGQRCPGGAVDARRKGVRVVGWTAGEPEHVAVRRIEHDSSAVEVADRVERILDRSLDVEIDGQLQPLALGRTNLLERPHFTPGAVDDDPLRTVLAHQQRVVDLLDTRLPDDVAALQVGGTGHLRVADFADIAEKMCGERFGVLTGRHLLHDDVGEFARKAAGGDRCHLGQRRVLDDGDRAVRGLAAVTLNDVAHRPFLEAEDLRQQPDRTVEVLGLLADDRDAVGVAVLDENLAVAVEEHAARGAQRQRALVVVRCHLLEAVVLHDLQVPEADGQDPEQHHGEVLEDAQPESDALPFLVKCHQENTRTKRPGHSRTLRENFTEHLIGGSRAWPRDAARPPQAGPQSP